MIGFIFGQQQQKDFTTFLDSGVAIEVLVVDYDLIRRLATWNVDLQRTPEKKMRRRIRNAALL